MNRYRFITLILSLTTVILGIYYEPILFYALPIYIVLSWLYLRSNSYMAIVSGMLLTCFSTLSMEAISVLYGLITPIPILIPALEGGFRDVEHPTLEYSFYGLGSSAVYSLITSVSILFLAIFRYTFIVIPIIASIYVLTRSYTVGREAQRLEIGGSEAIHLIRDNIVNYSIKIYNASRVTWILVPPEKVLDSVTLYIQTEQPGITLDPGREGEIPIRVRGDKIGSYTLRMGISCVDSLGLSHRALYIDLNIVVRPKLSLGLWIAGRLLETYGGRGELESISHRPTRLAEARTGLFFGVRPFIQGDEPRYIHFKKSVEHQQLMIKEYEAAGIKPSVLLVDTAVSTPEDLDEVLYNTVTILINHVVEELGEVGIVIYNSKNIILSLPPMAPINILSHLFRKIPQVKVEPYMVEYVLDEVEVEHLISSKSPVASFEYTVLSRRLDESILDRVLKDILSFPVEPLRIILVSSNSRFRNLYPLLRYILRRYGHEFISKIDIEGTLEADMDRLMSLSTIWIRSRL